MKKLNYAIEQRLRFIDYLLYRYGHISRITVMGYFGIGKASATRDFKQYREMAPFNTEYSIAERRYVKRLGFKSIYNTDMRLVDDSTNSTR